MTIKEILEKSLTGIGGSYETYLAPNIPEKKLLNAAKYIAGGTDTADILAICDGTVFGSAKDGLVFTEKKFYAKSFSDVFSIEYNKIEKVELINKKIIVYDDNSVAWESNLYDSIKLSFLLNKIINSKKDIACGTEESQSKETFKAVETDSNEEEKPVIEEKTPVKENIAPIDFDTTINQHKLPLQTKLGEFDNFLGLKFGSNILKNVFFLRCFGWKVDEFYIEKRKGENNAVVYLTNEDAEFLDEKTEGINLFYRLTNLKNSSLTGISIAMKECTVPKFNSIKEIVINEFVNEDISVRENILSYKPLNRFIFESPNDNNSCMILYFSTEENPMENFNYKTFKRVNFAGYFAECKDLYAFNNFEFMNLFPNQFLLSRNQPSPSYDYSDSTDRDFLILFPLITLYLLNENEQKKFAQVWKEMLERESASLDENENYDDDDTFERPMVDNLIAYLDSPRDSFDKSKITKDIKQILFSKTHSLEESVVAKKSSDKVEKEIIITNQENTNLTQQENITMENELAIVNEEGLLFSEILEKIKNVSYVLDDSQIIAQTNAGDLKISFYPESVQLCIADFNVPIQYGEFSRLSVANSGKKDESGEPIWNLLFDQKKIASFDEDDAQDTNKRIALLNAYFSDKATCSPKYEVTQKIKENDINASCEYNQTLYTLLLKYSSKFEEIIDEELLIENSKILQLIEEHSGKILGNLGATLKKNLSLKGLLNNGLGGLVATGMDIGKAIGDRVSGDFLSSDTGIMILTDKNVISALKTETAAYDFEDFYTDFKAKDDEHLENVVDIFNEDDEKIIEDVAKPEWLTFRKKVKKLKKEAEEMPIVQGNPEPVSPMQNLMTGQTEKPTSLTCDKCGSQSPIGTKFCLNCGDPFILCPACGQDNPSETKFCVFCGSPMKLVCKNCGASYIAGAKFCGECGQKL